MGNLQMNSVWQLRLNVGLGPIELRANRRTLVDELGQPRTCPGGNEFGAGVQDFFLQDTVQVHYDLEDKVTMVTVWKGGPSILLGDNRLTGLKPAQAKSLLGELKIPAYVLSYSREFWMLLEHQAWLKWDEQVLKAVSVFGREIYKPSRFIRADWSC
jgi:hypothetical protein